MDEKMSTRSLTVAKETVRPAASADLNAIATLARLGHWPAWVQEDLPRLLKSRYASCKVVEASGRLAGFAIGSIRHVVATPRRWGATCAGLFRRLIVRRENRLVLDLFDVAMAADTGEAELEHALLERLYQELRQRGQCVRIVVPESSLPAQVFLHEAGYRAVRVLRGYYGDQDGYLMQTRPKAS